MNIAVFNTGGTISCVGNPLTPMSATDFANACQSILGPILSKEFPDLTITYIKPIPGGPGWFPESSSGTLDSTNLQPTDWCIIADYILTYYADYDGWVILHGTDSMDFTGTALPLLLSSFAANGVPTAVLSKPVIITGSQVPLFYQSTPYPPIGTLTLNYNTDAYQNVCGAIAAAQSGIPEVCVYFQNNLYRGSRSVKTNASEFNAFSSPNYPALAEYGINLSVDQEVLLPGPVSYNVSLDNPEVLQNTLNQLSYITANINNFPVMQLNAFPAWYGYNNTTGILSQLITACVGQNIKGLVLESYGEGNYPSGCPDTPSKGAVYQALQAANNKGVIIVDCTQVLAGVVNDNAYAAGAWLPAVGALNPADMTPMAALGKLMILMTAAGYGLNRWTPAQVKTLFQMNLVGEMMSVSLLDSRINSQLLSGESLNALDGSSTLTNDPVLGPVLTGTANNNTQVLWKAFPGSAPAATDMPGKLIMQNDGNLVYYSRYNRALWATNTGNPDGASSMLMITGSYSNNSLKLQVLDYSANMVTANLYG